MGNEKQKGRLSKINKAAKKSEYTPDFFEKIENFLHSDTPAATATKYTLMFLAVGGVAFGGAVIPGIFKAMEVFAGDGYDYKKYPRKKIGNSITYLKQKKLIRIVQEKNGQMKVELTNKGKKRLVEYSIDLLRIKKPKKWDKKWSVLVFDIPTHPKIYNQAREALRGKIKELGFFQMQKSVWVYPYECEDELLFVAELYHVQRFIEILTVEKVLHEEVLLKKFRLKK